MAIFQEILRGFLYKNYTPQLNTKAISLSPSFLKAFSTPSNAITPDSIIEDFETIPDLFIVTDYVATQCSNVPTKIVKPSGRIATTSKLHSLRDKPNGYQNWPELIKTFFAYYEPLGNAYLYGIRPTGFGDLVTQLYCLPANHTTVLLEGKKELPAWMNEVAGYQVEVSSQKYNLPANDVLHKRYITLRYNDGSWVYGISKYVPGDKINRELKAIYDAKTSIIEKRGAMGFISNDSEFPDQEQSKLVKDRLSSNYGLGDSQDKFIVTGEKLRWQQMSLGVQELQLIENARYSFEKMCQLSGFDPVIFSTEGSTFANKEIAEREFFRKVIKPKVDDFYNDLNSFLGDGYGGDMILPDWSKVPELAEDREAQTNMLEKQIQSGILTPYKAHEMLYDDVDENNPPPDEYYIKTSLKKVLEPEPEPIVEPIITADDIKKLSDGS